MIKSTYEVVSQRVGAESMEGGGLIARAIPRKRGCGSSPGLRSNTLSGSGIGTSSAITIC